MTKKKDSKGGMEYEEMPLTQTKGLGKKLKVKTAKELSVGTLTGIVIAKITAAFGRMVAAVSKWMGRLIWRFTKKHKVALLSIYAVAMTLFNLMPFLPELIKTTIMGVL